LGFETLIAIQLRKISQITSIEACIVLLNTDDTGKSSEIMYTRDKDYH